MAERRIPSGSGSGGQVFPDYRPALPPPRPWIAPGRWQPQPHRAMYEETIKRLDNAAVTAYQQALGDGNGVTVAAVLGRMLCQLGIYSLESIGVQMHQVPCLRTLSAIEGKVNAYIVAYVAGNRITTLHDLVLGLCEEERVDTFDDLGLGPVVKHALVQQIFSAGLMQVYKITALEVLEDLNRLMEKKQHVDPAALLSFIAEERSVDVKRLCVRIQSLGMYIGITREVKRKEKEALQKWEANMKKAREQREAIQRALRGTQTNTNVESSASQKPSHIRFCYSDSDSDDNKAVPPRHSTCPFPSSREEQRKPCGEMVDNEFSLKKSAVSDFVRTWKRCCHDFPVTEVLKRMLAQVTSEKNLRRLFKLFKTRPALALLNIAVASMKGCFHSSDEDMDATVQCSTAEVEKAFESLSGFDYEISRASIVEFVATWRDTCRDCSVAQALNHILADTKGSRKVRYFKFYPVAQILHVALASINSGEWDVIAPEAISDDDDVVALVEAPPACTGTNDEVFSVIKEHFERYVPTTHGNGRWWCNVLNWAIGCEKLLYSSFTDKVFSSLGCKSLLNYLEVHLDRVMVMENRSLIDTTTVPRHRMQAFGRQASNADATLSEKDISVRCCKQFNLATTSFEDLTPDDIRRPSTVYFSVALLGEYLPNFSAQVGKLGSKTDADAEACLVKAPMLADLTLWSQWTDIYEPQLGPLLEWLEHGRCNRQVLAVATRDGKLLRVDGDASVDSFLDAVVNGRSLDVAAQLVSLVVLYGGAARTPKALLQTHALKGLQIYFDRARVNNGRKRKQENHHEAACFILDCLASAPHDFIEFSAEVLYAGLSRLFPDAGSLLLQNCSSVLHHLMLHRVGLALGVPQWINDYSTFEAASHADESYRDSSSACENHFKKPRRDETVLSERQPGSQLRSVKKEVADMSEESLDSDAREVVRMIRKDEFGFEEQDEVTQSGLLAKQHARMGRALECLSQNLYSEDCHFILELVQNADDNSYPLNAHPTLAFIIQKDRIVVLNNEKGFTAKNIRALCDVGKSTKKGVPAGYIGHKGIGFKSVFRVTESPQIHSNGFHVKFDISESSIGFILPTWVQSPLDNAYLENVLSQATGEDTWCINTRIDLPLRASVVEANSMSRMFQDVQPKLLLFLHKLRTVVVKNEASDSCLTMRRQDIGNNIIKLTDGRSTGTFLVVRQLLDAPMDRAGVPDTELALAFELKESRDGHYAALAVQQQVFAFLPVRSYGLKFVVQGDFILPSSREDLDRDSAWNQWLRAEVPKLFLQSLHCFQSSAVFGSRIEAISSYLSYVPVEGEVLGFFSSVPRIILSLLRAAPCLPVEGSELWSLPCTTLRGWGDAFRLLVPDDMLKKYLGLLYLDREVIISDILASALGVPEYGVETLVGLLKAAAKSLDDLGIGWLRRCLVEIHKCFAYEKQNFVHQEQKVAGTLRGVPFIPLSSGGFTSLEDGLVWFLDGEGLQGRSKDFLDLYSDIRTVSPFLIDEESTAGTIKEMLVKLGVKVVTAHEVIKSHVLPAMASVDCLKKDPSLLLQYLAYCALHFELDNCRSCQAEKDGLLSQLRNTAIVLTKDGLRSVAEHSIHFGKELGNIVDVEKLLEDAPVPWCEVDSKYLQFNPSPAFWRKFFMSLGVSDFINVLPSKVRVGDKSSTVWKNESWKHADGNTAWIIQDWGCADSFRICNALARSGRPENCRLFLTVLDSMWDEHYDRFSKGSYSVEGAPSIGGDCESSFVLQLRGYAWIGSSLDHQLHKPTELFHKSVESMLGSYVSYARPQVGSSKLAKALGLHTEVRLEDIINLMKLLNEREKEGSCSISIGQMERVYTFLCEKMDKQELQRQFESTYIFLPSVRVTRTNENVTGNLYSAAQVTWEDPFGFDDSTDGKVPVRTLCHVYSAEMRDFFVEGCCVPDVPDFDAYISILQHIAGTVPPSKLLDKVLELFAHWSRELDNGKMKPEELDRRKNALRASGAPILPTTQNTWTGLTDADRILCWCDDAKLVDAFDYLDSAVKFVDVGRSSASIVSFLTGIGVPRFSEVVEKEAIIYGPNSSPELENIISLVLPYCQRYLVQFHPENYRRCKEDGCLREFQCFIVDRLFSRYKLKSTGFFSRHRIPCNCLLEDNKLYVSSTHIQEYASIFLELSRLFFSGTQHTPLANFLHLVALQAKGLADDDDLESLVSSSQNLMPLPTEEAPWKLGGSQRHNPSTSTMAARADEFLERQRTKSKTARHSIEAPGDSAVIQKQNVIDLDDYNFTEQQADDAQELSVVDRDKLVSSRPANREQQEVTGRNGEKMVYEHLCRKHGQDAMVSWVNEEVETGCAYDIVVEWSDGRKKFVEVKSTRSSSKDWFELSPWEWEFASKMGDGYSIIRIQMLQNKQQARLMTFDNPVQLCRDKVLQLAVLVPHS
ncbi:uncharacterized protein LOC9630255 [Selaginella moellendorffii]|uniref:uncharacterized protein LOC9630255 n=1 Tax=Selaginella moellendorffii TaxID=88036 RepID=UPI000D1CC242|nr:uncharacterized protein LOC9630255 [Selaginella moellendorffii]|eukprot:XP_024517181.1 uncharacterized protein LOC9630255 [Selaginella moellendorffii]